MSTRVRLEGGENLGTKWDTVVEQPLFGFYLSATLVMNWRCLCDFHNWFGVNKYLVYPSTSQLLYLRLDLFQFPKLSVFLGDPYVGDTDIIDRYPRGAKHNQASGDKSRSTWLVYWSVLIISVFLCSPKKSSCDKAVNDFLLHFLRRFAGFITALKELIGYRVLNDQKHCLLECNSSHSAALRHWGRR